MVILGIESTAHTFGVGIVRNGKILSNVTDSFTTEQGGMIPMEVAKHHAECNERVYSDSLEKAGITEDEIDAIAFFSRPQHKLSSLKYLQFH